MRKLLITLSVVLVAGSAFATAAEAAPLNLRMKTEDGKARIKVGRKLPVILGCSKKCSGRLTMTLVMPGHKDPVSGNVVIDAGETFRARYLLTRFGLRLLRDHVSKSKLRVEFSVVDLETRKRTIKRRVFRFRR